jgi:L-alanine-DL-glutamate epimerase-like enolase superfamily enzyme
LLIRDLEFFSVAIPLPTMSSSGGRAVTRSLIVRLVSHVGVEGWGEAVRTAMPLESLLPLRNQLLPMLMGRNVFDLEEFVRLDLQRFGSIRFAIETACWDMMGRICKQPICRFLGGEYRSHIPMTMQLTGKTPNELAAASQELANRGYHWQSLTLTGQWDDDLRLVRHVLDSLHHGVELRIDVAGQYEQEDCDKLLALLEKSGVSLLIDPLKDATPQQLAMLQKRTPIPLGIRSGMDSARDVLDVAGCGNLSWLILEPQRLGSLLELRKCADIAEAAGLHCIVDSCGSSGLITAAIIQSAAALPALSHGLYCTPSDLNAGILKDPFNVSGGLLHLALGPGLGIEIDRTKLEQFLVA